MTSFPTRIVIAASINQISTAIENFIIVNKLERAETLLTLLAALVKATREQDVDRAAELSDMVVKRTQAWKLEDNPEARTRQ